MKRVLLLVVDGCTSRVMRPALEAGQLPTLAALAGRGTIAYDCVSIFPSITPAATASIVTGRYPRAHAVAGMSWWNRSTDRVSYYGDDVMTVWQRGLGTYVCDFLLKLNHERLQAPTVFQTAERQGLTAGCVNHLIFQGDVPHRVRPPLLMQLWPTMPDAVRVYGPSLLCLGDFVSDRPGGRPLAADGGMLSRFGMDDEGTMQFLLDVKGPAQLPDVTVAYFADYDFASHDAGPESALDTLRTFDSRLATILDQWGGLDRVVRELCLMLTADHSHSDVRKEAAAGIVLDDLLSAFPLAHPGDDWTSDEELMVCGNMRAAEIYFRRPEPARIARVCRALLEAPQVDQVIWREGRDDRDPVRVTTRDRGELAIVAGAPDAPDALRDAYGGAFALDGSLEAIGARRAGACIEYGDYPNALERIAAGLEHPKSGRIWVTARPGYEFQSSGQSLHGRGGSHGSLHALDSLVPFLVAGAPAGLGLPAHSRIVDVEPLCRRVLGLRAGGTAPGDSHA